LPLFFALTLFVSSALLFLVQPMIGKIILPQLGGTPAVWNTCMVFFQAALLAGYGYAHALTGRLPTRRQIVLHLCVMLLPFLVLPFGLGNWVPPSESNPIPALLLLLLVMVGLPFFVVSTSAPLLQAWFASTGHHSAKDPYYLYAASNLGSMLALLSYPLLVEPNLRLDDQRWAWAVGYGVLVALAFGCAALVWGRVGSGPAAAAPREEPGPGAEPPGAGRLSVGRRLRWIALAAVPSSLLLGVTSYLSTDIAAIPLLWVVPLALYLLTFIIVFSRKPFPPHSWMVALQPFVILALVLMMVTDTTRPIWRPVALNLVAFFITALVCHGELARDRPPTRHLTEFFLWMSVGGVLGGIFNALVAPLVFLRLVEYPLAIVFACLLRPPPAPAAPDQEAAGSEGRPPAEKSLLARLVEKFNALDRWFADPRRGSEWQRLALDLVLPLIVGVAAWYLWLTPRTADWSAIVRYGIPVVFCFTLAERPLRFGLGVAALLAVSFVEKERTEQVVYSDRSFFGLIRVKYEREYGTEYHTLVHGGIIHGRQFWEEGRHREPLTYYHRTGPIGQVLTRFQWFTWQGPPPYCVASLAGLGAVPWGPVAGLGFEPVLEETKWWFDWEPSDARLPASLVGLAAAPLAPLVGLYSEPPYAVIGLGTGTMAAYSKPGQHVTFFEIDPAVERTAWNPDLFTYLSDARARGARVEIRLGDARLRMKDAPDGYYHVIAVDAFSSDAIPIHLITSEALDLYMKKLAPGGILAFHISNRYVDLETVLGDLAKEKNLVSLDSHEGGGFFEGKLGSEWVVLARKPADLDYLRAFHKESNGDWVPAWNKTGDSNRPVWKDDYSNMLSVFFWDKR
jgi:hypothetical protein